MSTTSPDVDAALVAAAQVLPAHFADPAELTITPLDAIQATTMSLPGGAYAVESVLKGAPANVGNVTLIVTGLVDHKDGEIFSRDDARTVWTAALTETLTALTGELGEFTPGQLHMTDAFDALDKADEAQIAGVFKGDTLAGMLLAMPATSTGEGAAAQLAAAVAAAEAAEAGEDAEESEETDASGDTGADVAGAGTGGAAEAAAAGGVPGGPAGGPGDPGMPGGVPGVPGAGFSAQAQAAAAARAQQDAERYAAEQAALQAGVSDVAFQPFAGVTMGFTDPRRIDLLRDVVMGVSVELGRTRLTVQEILGLTPGSIVELDRAAGAPVDVLVHGTLIAHGEVVVVDEEFAVRISEVVTPDRDGRVTT
ncbi:flagellar motor switch protein FliN [Agilicoccus flavus]|uniref:flagellar motor switch protein FliN n=1 Tax=Agilicoccus flavus TaxID=2775968 RepID=UPI001CF6CE08|nr:flagellar motor switch protein FliN [Agilicoccus flavus]